MLDSSDSAGTSGMKAALNGGASLSVLDGWWIEGHVEGVTRGYVLGYCALNGSFFNSQCILSQYLRNAYFPAEG